MNSCAGHFPNYKAYIQIERNADFEEYAMNSQFVEECVIRPILEIDFEKYDPSLISVSNKGAYYPKSFIKDTGKTSFNVHTLPNIKKKYLREHRDWFLKWLLEY